MKYTALIVPGVKRILISIKNISLVSHLISMFKAPEATVSFLGDMETNKPHWQIIEDYDASKRPQAPSLLGS